MKFRALVSEQMGRMLAVLARPHRLRIVEELGVAERDVATLQSVLGIRHSGVSQHLAMLRSRDLVVERREGRHVFYRLVEPALASWLLEGLRFIEPEDERSEELKVALRNARAAWTPAPRAVRATGKKKD